MANEAASGRDRALHRRPEGTAVDPTGETNGPGEEMAERCS